MHFGKGITAAAAALGPASLRPHVAGAAASMLRRLLLQAGCSAVSAVRRRSGLRTGLQWRCSVPSAPPCMHRTLHPPSSMHLHSFSTLMLHTRALWRKGASVPHMVHIASVHIARVHIARVHIAAPQCVLCEVHIGVLIAMCTSHGTHCITFPLYCTFFTVLME